MSCARCHWAIIRPGRREDDEWVPAVAYCSYPTQCGRALGKECEHYESLPMDLLDESEQMKVRESETVTIRGKIFRETQKAVLVRWKKGEDPVWLPLSVIEIHPLSRSEVEIELPLWLAKDKGIHTKGVDDEIKARGLLSRR